MTLGLAKCPSIRYDLAIYLLRLENLPVSASVSGDILSYDSHQK